MKDLLDQKKKHPFYAHAEMQCFLAYSDSKPAGRIAAILDKNQFAPDSMGFFGFLEMADSQPVADESLGAAWSWLKQRGARTMRWARQSIHQLRVRFTGREGFDSSPFVMMT